MTDSVGSRPSAEAAGSRQAAVGSPPLATIESGLLPGPAASSQSVLARVEDAIGSLALLVMVVLPLAEIVSRRAFSRGIPG